jgi:hypothetical protein
MSRITFSVYVVILTSSGIADAGCMKPFDDDNVGDPRPLHCKVAALSGTTSNAFLPKSVGAE